MCKRSLTTNVRDYNQASQKNLRLQTQALVLYESAQFFLALP
ncbi:hypothetical protein VCHA54P489_30021 [Vibrio chagasii]|nr:hypothetical protein VCHA54P489_30021 [Vibrio chagasii]CAH7295778.1 hypothetical protein VCHA37P202_30020 [Vibrio chagasii]